MERKTRKDKQGAFGLGSTMKYHEPVLLKEVIEHLKVNKDSKYIDATLGDAGHTLPILARGGRVLGIEINPVSLARASARIAESGLSDGYVPARGNFKEIESIAVDKGFSPVDGILYDLGYSSFELESETFGLSFQKDSPLDMRLDPDLGVTAADLVNALSEEDLSMLISGYSDEHLSKRFAKAIVSARNLRKIQTTAELAEIIKNVSPPNYENGRIHPATRTFQALRIAVNNDLENLENSLARAAHLLLPGGRMVIISFHSLEDRVVKKFGLRVQPKIEQVVKKPIVPSDDEVRANPRARSAKMRVFEKCVN